MSNFQDAHLSDGSEPIPSITFHGMKQHSPKSGYLRANTDGKLWSHGDVDSSRFLNHGALVEPVGSPSEECGPKTSIETSVGWCGDTLGDAGSVCKPAIPVDQQPSL